MILHEKTKQEFGYDWDSASQTKKFYCTCDYCGKEFLRDKKTIKQCNQTVTKDSCGKGLCKKTKSEEVQLIKFGVKNFGGSKEAQEKGKETCLERYDAEFYQNSEQRIKDNQEKFGVDHHTQTQEWKNKIKEVHLENCGYDHHTKDPAYQKQLSERCLEKYGETHFMKTKWFREKIDDIMRVTYGDDYWQKEEFKEKRKKTNLERYGFEFPMQSPNIKNKVNDFFKEKYGMHYTQTEEFKEKLVVAYQAHYGVNHYSQTQEFKDVMIAIWEERYGQCIFKDQGFKDNRRKHWEETYDVRHYAQTQEFREKFIKTCMERYGQPHPPRKYGVMQKSILEWLNSFSLNFKLDDVDVLGGKEIDMYEENLKIGIEYCGLYWHNEQSPEPRNKDYHYSKYQQCSEKGVRLITIFEDEWIFREQQCKNYLKSVLGISERKIFARKCEVKEVPKNVSNDFYDKHHIMGDCHLIEVSLGLYDNDELLGVMSLGKHHRQQKNNNSIVLNRLCFKDGVQVIGGASKLFKQCKEWAKAHGYSFIMSWSDNRWSNGDIYRTLGFDLNQELKPDYSYVDLNTTFVRVSKQSQMKSATDCPKDKTEKEWCLERNLVRIWDCGKKRWIYNLT